MPEQIAFDSLKAWHEAMSCWEQDLLDDHIRQHLAAQPAVA
jgi:hypothetical protein